MFCSPLPVRYRPLPAVTAQVRGDNTLFAIRYRAHRLAFIIINRVRGGGRSAPADASDAVYHQHCSPATATYGVVWR